jgi:hypothetical protein
MARVNWDKRGLIFRPDPSRWWQRSHASLPCTLDLGDGLHRVYFASRDDAGRSHVGWFDADLHDGRVVDTVDEPVLAPGPLGHFDDRGIYAASVVRDGERVLMYTIGWNVGTPPPLFYATIGLAISSDGGRTFAKHGRSPIMARSDHDPCLVTSPVVLREGGRWRMWYVSGEGWDQEGDGPPRSRYHVKHAESADGVHWRRDGHVCLTGDRNIARACVVGGHRAWYGYDRGEGYRVGYAESPDGLAWERRDDEAGIAVSESGWDSEALAYPWVVPCGERLAMLYNGNGFGRDGIGLALSSGP